MQASAVLINDNDAVAEVSVASHADVLNARRWARSMAIDARLNPADIAVVVAAVSELARNIVLHAKRGAITLRRVEHGDRRGIRVVASDRGPGTVDLERAMRSGFSTSGSPLLGLRVVMEVVDGFQIDSSPSRGTRVVVTKWKSRDSL